MVSGKDLDYDGETNGGAGEPISEISPESPTCQEGLTKQFNTEKAIRVRPRKTPAIGSLCHYNNKGLGPTADELVAIWLKLGIYPFVYKGGGRAITAANPQSGECLIRAHLRI